MADRSPDSGGGQARGDGAPRARILLRITRVLAGVPAADVPGRLCTELLAFLPVHGLALSLVADGT